MPVSMHKNSDIRPYWQSDCGRAVVYLGDNMPVMLHAGDAQFHAVVTDPPYNLSFMNKEWDTLRSGKEFQQWFFDRATQMLRVSKPGAHLLSFGGTRMFHRMACAVEDAGWEIRDCLMWLYGSGFPKSMDVSKQIDKMAGVERTVVGNTTGGLGSGQFTKDAGLSSGYGYSTEYELTVPATDDAKRWDGWGTSLKPAWEPVVLARRVMDGNTAECVLEHGTGALNIDACRVGDSGGTGSRGEPSRLNAVYGDGMGGQEIVNIGKGRWPANVLTDGSDAQLCRYFYSAKADATDRPHGKGGHPTVKPLDLMRYLVNMVCPRGGVVLDPFMGSGSTGVAAIHEGMSFAGIEQSQEYADIAVGRLKLALESAPDRVDLVTRTVVPVSKDVPPPAKKLKLR